ncbi:uncharacterized protein LOC109798970 [Cajanus cajan]|uniref:uncharacterized protein LOC109798970 n=1 Tax=Cajanus cajan TaxID=3821 RepID=UPI00098DC01E|nr:uncharacterized protein LOC109798970 [Cajanus cajan]
MGMTNQIEECMCLYKSNSNHRECYWSALEGIPPGCCWLVGCDRKDAVEQTQVAWCRSETDHQSRQGDTVPDANVVTAADRGEDKMQVTLSHLWQTMRCKITEETSDDPKQKKP